MGKDGQKEEGRTKEGFAQQSRLVSMRSHPPHSKNGKMGGSSGKKQHVERQPENRRMCQDNHTSGLRTASSMAVAVGRGPYVDSFFSKHLEGSVLLNGNHQ